MTVTLSNTPCRVCRQLIAEAALVDGNPLCPSCELAALERDIAEARRLGEVGKKVAAEAHPDAMEKVLRLIETVRPGATFSANDLRERHGVSGPVVGAAFSAARKAGLIRSVGFVTSSDPGTHGHPVRQWERVAA